MTIFGAGVNEAFKYDRHFNMNITGDDMKETYAKGYFDVAAKLPTPPRSVAILAVDNEFAQKAAESARHHARQRGLRVVYDRSYPPTTVDFTPTDPRHPVGAAGRGVHRLLPAGFQRHPPRHERAALQPADVRRRHGRAAARRLPGAVRARS